MPLKYWEQKFLGRQINCLNRADKICAVEYVKSSYVDKIIIFNPKIHKKYVPLKYLRKQLLQKQGNSI